MLDKVKLSWINLISDKKFSEILTGSIWALGAQVGVTIVAMFTSIIVARFYGAEIMGIVAMINSFMSLAVVFAIMGTDISILRLIPEHTAKYSATSAFHIYQKVQYFVAAMGLLFGALLFLSSGIIANQVFSKPHLSFFIALSSALLIFPAMAALNTQAARGLRLIRMFAFLQLLPAVSKFLILIVITLFFFNPYNPVYAIFASSVLTAILGALIVRMEFEKRIQPTDPVHHLPMKGILSISLPMLMTATIHITLGQTGVLILGMFRTEAEVGYYDIAVKLSTLTVFVLNAINSMAAPKFSELFHSGNMEDLFHVAQKSTRFIFWATTPILMALVLFGKPIISVLFGQEFTAAYGPMMVLVAGQFINSISGSTGYFMDMTGNQNIFRNIVLGAAITVVCLGFLLVPPFGTIGAAIAGTMGLILWNLGTLLYIKLKYGKNIGYLPFFHIKQSAATHL